MKTIAFGSLVLIFGLCSCGGGSSGGSGDSEPPEPATLRVGKLFGGMEGMRYQSGETMGSMTSDGLFMYEEFNGQAQTVQFAIGDVTLATVGGAESLTLLDFVGSSGIDSIELGNIVSFLLFLDADQNVDNGLSLSTALLDFLDNNSWAQINFSDPDFSNQSAVTMIVADVVALENDGRALPNAGAARFYLNIDHLCRSSGVYRGEFMGDDEGYFVVGIFSFDGLIIGGGFSTIDPVGFQANGNLVLTGDNSAFSVGDTTIGASFFGNLENFSELSGTWQNTTTDDSGTFTGSREATREDDFLRYLLVFGDNTPSTADDRLDNFGFIHLVVNQDNTANATMVNFFNDAITLSGGVTLGSDIFDNELVLQSSDGNITIAGNISLVPVPGDPAHVRVFDGTFTNANTGLVNGVSGGTGCRVN